MATEALEPPLPRENAELEGHGAAEAVLLRAAASGRLPHAWLITGPRGIGKATLAFRFARYLLKDGAGEADLFGNPPDSLRVDPEDPVFRMVAAGGHGDLRLVERQADERNPNRLRREIVVGDLRAVVDFLHMTAAAGGWRIVIVDSADEMNGAAANALLKVLEEPPPRALLILVSHTPGRLLPTIRSRCCHLALAPLAEDTLGRLLERYRPGLEPGEARTLVGLADGSIGRALGLAAGGGLELYRILISLLAGLPDTPVDQIHAFGDRLAKDSDGASFRTGTELLLWWLARMIHMGSQGGSQGGSRGGSPGDTRNDLPEDAMPGERDIMARLLARRSVDQWLDLWEKLSSLFARTEGANLDRRQVVVTAFIDLQTLSA